LDDAAAIESPLIEISAPEEQLASRAVLLSGNGALGSELPKGVSVDTQVLSRTAAVKPFGSAVGHGRELGGDCCGDALCEILDESIKSRELILRSASKGAFERPLAVDIGARIGIVVPTECGKNTRGRWLPTLGDGVR
jgi:hypothetical protein